MSPRGVQRINGAHASSAGQVIFGEFLRQRQTGLYEPLGEHQASSFDLGCITSASRLYAA
jgi:hypothetical protein